MCFTSIPDGCRFRPFPAVLHARQLVAMHAPQHCHARPASPEAPHMVRPGDLPGSVGPSWGCESKTVQLDGSDLWMGMKTVVRGL